MRRADSFFVGCGIVTASILCAAAVSSKPSPESSEIAQLKKEVAELRQRVQSIEEHLTVRVRLVGNDGTDRSIIPIPPHFPWNPAPKDWKPFEFNGRTYYLVPIDAADKPTSSGDPNK